MKYFILAGEASGDKQAALLCQEISNHDPQANISGWGGEEMTAAGATITKHYKELAFMGFIEVIKHLPDILRNFKTCKAEINAFRPDAVILVDYPGFNLRMASWAHREGYTVYYYISPQLWAWHTSRVHQVKKAIRKMYVILPFEKEFYKKYNVDAFYIGHPLAMNMKDEDQFLFERKPGVIALLPGSRKSEIEKVLPEMIKLAGTMPEKSFHIAAVDHLSPLIYKDIIGSQANVTVTSGDMHRVLYGSEAAVVTSGTATLETALTGTPQVVVYKGNPLSFQIAKWIVKVPYISLVNLILKKPLVPELLQEECNAQNIHAHLNMILDSSKYAEIREGYQHLYDILRGGGPSSAAKDIITDLKTLQTT